MIAGFGSHGVQQHTQVATCGCAVVLGHLLPRWPLRWAYEASQGATGRVTRQNEIFKARLLYANIERSFHGQARDRGTSDPGSLR